MRRNNNWDFGFRSQIRRDIPKGIFLNQTMSLRMGLRGSGSDLITGRDIDIEQNNIFMNYWSIKWATRFNPQVFEDDDLFRDSRAMVILNEAWESYELELSTDRRKRMIFRPSVDFTHGEIRGWGREYKLSTTVRPTDYINMTLSVSDEYQPSFMQWVGIVEDSIGTANIIYAESEQWKNIVNLRLNWAFSPTMTLECFYHLSRKGTESASRVELRNIHLLLYLLFSGNVFSAFQIADFSFCAQHVYCVVPE